MADKKQQLDGDQQDHFGDFDAFDDSDDFSFDDEQSFQFDEDEPSSAETVATSDYEFTADEALLDENELTQANPSLADKLMSQFKGGDSKRLIIYALAGVLGIALALGMLYKMIFSDQPAVSSSSASPSLLTGENDNLYHSGSSMESPSTPVLSLPPVTTDVETAHAVVMPAASQSISAQASAQLLADNQAYQKRVEILEAQVSQLNTQLISNTQLNTSNQAQIADLIKTINSLQTQVTRVNKAMKALLTGVSNAGGLAAVSGNASTTSSVGIPSAPSYYVQAIIPGRAWLKNAAGQIITVAVGDNIAGYGTVTNIDSQNGVVTTSTGTRLIFGISAP